MTTPTSSPASLSPCPALGFPAQATATQRWTLTPGPDLVTEALAALPAGQPQPEDVRTLVPLTAIVTSHAAMVEALTCDRESETPDEPVWLRVRADVPGRYEIADGHHRVAAALRAGHTTVLADIDLVPDDEPYQAPFFDFAAVIPAC